MAAKKKKPLVSVIIPAYNHEAFVGEAVDSVGDQQFDALGGAERIELIVVDDGSSDQTAAIAAEHAAELPGEGAAILHQENQGTAAALRAGFELARGDYLAILNSDDRYAPRRLERLVGALAGDAGAGLAMSGVRLIDGAGKELASGPEAEWLAKAVEAFKRSGDLAASLLRDNFACSTSNFVFTRAAYEAVGGFSPLLYVNDLDFLFKVLAREKVLFVEEELLDYRIHASNTMRQKSAQRAEFIVETSWVTACALADGGLFKGREPSEILDALSLAGQLHFDPLCVAAMLARFADLAPEGRASLILPGPEREAFLSLVSDNLARADNAREIEEANAWNAAKVVELDKEVAGRGEEIARLDGLVAEGNARIAELNKEVAGLKDKVDEIWRARVHFQERLEEAVSSRAWKLGDLKKRIRSPRDLPMAFVEFWRIVLSPRAKERAKRLMGGRIEPERAARALAETGKKMKKRLTPARNFSQSRFEGPLISVIVPCYNSGSHLPGLFASLDAQSLKNFEVILVDDGSDEAATVAAIQELEEQGRANLKVLHQENQGVIAARNAGLELARGRYAYPLDADDAIDPLCLEKLALFMEHSPPHVFAYPWTFSLGEEAFIWETRDTDPLELLRENRCGMALYPLAALKAVGGYNPAMTGGYEDWELVVRLVREGYVGRAVAEPLYHYFVRPGSRNFHANRAHVELARLIDELHGQALKEHAPALRKRAARRYKVKNGLVNLHFRPLSETAGPIDRIDLSGIPDLARTLRDAVGRVRATKKPLLVTGRPKHRFFFDMNPAPGLLSYFPANYDPDGNGAFLEEYLGDGVRTVTAAELAEQSRELPSLPAPGLRVLYVAPWLITGGADQMTVDWFRLLPDHIEAILVLTEPRRDEWLAKVRGHASEVYDLPDLGIRDFSDMAEFLAELIERRNVDVLHVMNSNAGYRAMPMLRKRFPELAIAAQFHCFDFSESGERVGYLKEVPAAADSAIDSYNVVSEALAREVVEVHPAISPDKFEVIYCCVDTEAYDPEGLIPRPEIAAKGVEGALNILFIGRLDAQKNPLRMARVAEELDRRGVGFVIHVLGGGCLDARENELEKFLRDKGLDSRVVRHGVQLRRDMASWYAVGDTLLMTSDWEGIPVVLYEAMAMGLPCVTSDVGGVAELVMPETGFVIPDASDVSAYADALQSLADDAGLREAMGRAARERVKAQFDIRSIGPAYADYYARLMAAKRGG